MFDVSENMSSVRRTFIPDIFLHQCCQHSLHNFSVMRRMSTLDNKKTYKNTITKTQKHSKTPPPPQKYKHKNTTTKTPPHQNKNTTTQTPPQEHHHTTGHHKNTTTPPEKHHHKHTHKDTTTPPQKHHTTTKTPPHHHHHIHFTAVFHRSPVQSSQKRPFYHSFSP